MYMRILQRDIVGAFIFSKDNKVLLGQSIKGGVYQDQWVVPGGGIEVGETRLEAMRREILEEVGLDISKSTTKELEKPSTGTSEKVLRDTGERVTMNMTFYDFVVQLDMDAKDYTLRFEDDLSRAEWFSGKELTSAIVGPATLKILKQLKFV